MLISQNGVQNKQFRAGFQQTVSSSDNKKKFSCIFVFAEGNYKLQITFHNLIMSETSASLQTSRFIFHKGAERPLGPVLMVESTTMIISKIILKHYADFFFFSTD